ELRTCPEVLQLRWLICAQEKKWQACIEIGQTLVELKPQDSFGWINRSYALRRTLEGGVLAAYNALLPAVDQIKDLEQVAFNLACYSCCLGDLDEATEWLKRSFAAAESAGALARRKREALEEPDLKP